MADSIRDSIRIRIVIPGSIRYSIRTRTADSQVPKSHFSAAVLLFCDSVDRVLWFKFLAVVTFRRHGVG